MQTEPFAHPTKTKKGNLDYERVFTSSERYDDFRGDSKYFYYEDPKGSYHNIQGFQPTAGVKGGHSGDLAGNYYENQTVNVNRGQLSQESRFENAMALAHQQQSYDDPYSYLYTSNQVGQNINTRGRLTDTQPLNKYKVFSNKPYFKENLKDFIDDYIEDESNNTNRTPPFTKGRNTVANIGSKDFATQGTPNRTRKSIFDKLDHPDPRFEMSPNKISDSIEFKELNTRGSTKKARATAFARFEAEIDDEMSPNKNKNRKVSIPSSRFAEDPEPDIFPKSGRNYEYDDGPRSHRNEREKKSSNPASKQTLPKSKGKISSRIDHMRYESNYLQDEEPSSPVFVEEDDPQKIFDFDHGDLLDLVASEHMFLKDAPPKFDAQPKYTLPKDSEEIKPKLSYTNAIRDSPAKSKHYVDQYNNPEQRKSMTILPSKSSMNSLDGKLKDGHGTARSKFQNAYGPAANEDEYDHLPQWGFKKPIPVSDDDEDDGRGIFCGICVSRNTKKPKSPSNMIRLTPKGASKGY